MSFWIALSLMPFVAGLHMYATDYGYRGYSKAQSWADAWRVTVMLLFIYAVVFIIYMEQ
jgi:hypothetical protein